MIDDRRNTEDALDVEDDDATREALDAVATILARRGSISGRKLA